MTDKEVFVLDDSFSTLKSFVEKPSCRSRIIKYIGFLSIGLFLVFNMYLDYKCTNVIVPQDYIITQSTSTMNYDTRNSRFLLDDNFSTSGTNSTPAPALASMNGTYQCISDAD